jgi:dTMP kinase
MTARTIVIEGCDGVVKTTQVQKLVDHLRSKGFSVLQTKEPGVHHSPLTMELRNVMLNAKYDNELTVTARELISQAIRSIHLEKVVVPALEKYDFIVQDRGVLSGLAYGKACGNNIDWLQQLADHVSYQAHDLPYDMLYDDVVYLTGNVAKGLEKAKTSKQEFEAGDAIENKGLSFMEQVKLNMDDSSTDFNVKNVSVDGKSIDEVFAEILKALEIEA